MLPIDQSDNHVSGLIFYFRWNFQQPRVIPQQLRINEVDAVLGKIGVALSLVKFEGNHGIENIPLLVRFQPSRALRRASIRGSPRTDDDWNAIVDCDNDSPDPARQVMPDYESQRQDLSW